MNMSSLKAYFNIGLSYIFKILPVSNKRIYFCSFHGQYSDSPRKISEGIYETLEGADIIWEISDKCNELPPNYVKKVKPYTIMSIYYRSTSKIIVDNYMGWSYGYAVPNTLQYHLLNHQKKRKQFNVCTWHGTALKRIGLDQPENEGKTVTFYSTADLLTANCGFMRDLYNHINQNKIPITMSGTPRNDVLFVQDEHLKKKIKSVDVQILMDKQN